MPPLPRRAFTQAVRRLDRDRFQAFVADVWAARGHETIIKGDRVIVVDPDGEERTVILPVADAGRIFRGRLRPPDGPVDIVVSVDRRTAGKRFAARGNATFIDHAELYRIALYAIDRERADRLFSRYLDRPATVPPPGDADPRMTSRVVWGSIVIIAVIAFTVVATGSGVSWLPASVVGDAADTPDSPLQAGPDPGDTLTHPRAQLATDINSETRSETEANEKAAKGSQSAIWDRPLPAIGTDKQAWRRFGYSRARTGYAPATTGPIGNVSISNTVDFRYRIIASPIVVDGRVYAADFAGYLFAINAETMAVGWQRRLNGRATATPTIVNGTLYAATARSTGTGQRSYASTPVSTLRAISTADGTRRWVRSFEPVVLSSPVVADGTLYIGSSEGTVHAVAATTGTDRWNTTIGGQVFSSPAISNGTLYIGSTDGGIYALSKTTGRIRWTVETDGDVLSSPAVKDDTVYVGSSDGRLYALDAETGQERWNHSTGDVIYSSPAVANGSVYIGNQAGHVIAIDASNGSERWNRTYRGAVLSSPAVTGETVYVGTEVLTETENGTQGGVVALETASGESKWMITTNGPVGSSPAVVDGTLFIGDYDGRLYQISGCTELETNSREAVWLADIACN